MPTLGSSRSVLASADVQTILDFEGKLAQRSLLLFGLGITLALSSTACGDSSGPKELAACEAGVPLSVGTGLTPVFSWAPDCTALTLYVKTSEGPQGAGANNTVWAIQVPPDSQGAVANRIRSGVTYGETPLAATELVPPIALKSGVPYTVFLEVSTGGASARVVASSIFTPM